MAHPGKSRVLLTWREFDQFPDDGLRHEIIEGDHYVSPAPIPIHQYVSMRIASQLDRLIHDAGLGVVYTAPIGLKMSHINVLQPDIVVLLGARRPDPDETLLTDRPDLLVEVLSKSTGARDRGLKRSLYARFKVPEYWIVDPVGQVVHQYALRGATYGRASERRDRIAMAKHPEIAIDLTTRVW